MKNVRSFLALACAMALGIAPVRANGDAAASWRAFFRTVIAASATNFASLRGAFDSTSGNYAVKASFYPGLVHDCIIFTTGAGDTQAWDLRCQLRGYSGQAMGPATPQGPLLRDLASALPHFKPGKNVMGEPQWIGGDNSVTVVFSGILVVHGYTGI
jgi:hypothetical protein